MKKGLILVIFTLLVALSGCNSSYEKGAYYEVSALEKTNYKKILGSQYKDLEIDSIFSEALLNFSYKTASDLLEDRNGMYSPISYFIALAELAELTQDSTRVEILNALYINDIDILRDGNHGLYQKLSYKNDISTLSIANSIWLNKDKVYNENSLEILRDKYYASSYGVDFANAADKKSISDWVSDNTGGKLGGNDFDDLGPSIAFVLLNTIYFYDEWNSKFDKDGNEFASFAGLEENVEYMSQVLEGGYFKNDEYESSSLVFKNGLRISFVAPYDSNNFVDFVSDEIKMKESLSRNPILNYLVSYKIPKYSYKSSFDLINYAKELGINKVFGVADFSPLSNEEIFVDAMYQKSFIEIDEEGGKAAAYTGIVGDTESVPFDMVDFHLNRPFVYAIYSGEYPLFIGTVTNPNSDKEEKYG